MRWLLLVLVILGLAGGVFFIKTGRQPILLAEFTSAQSSYQPIGPIPTAVSHIDDIAQVTNIEITPNGAYMLVATLPGTVWVYHKVDGQFRRQQEPFFVVKTAQPGWPPQEAGLTGIALGADFAKSGDVFLFYSFAKEKRSFRNRVMRVKFTKLLGWVKGTRSTQIFEASTPGTGSHQIQDGVGVLVGGVPHVLFTVGEGFVAERALKPEEEAGKVILIQADGNPAVGSRPFANSLKVQAIGVRNAPGIVLNATNNAIVIADTGPNNYDRLLYGTFYDPTGANDKQLSFHWDGTEEKQP